MLKLPVAFQRPAPRALSALAAQVITTGCWALIDPTFVARHAIWFILAGLAVFVVAYVWEEARSYLRWKRGARHLYITYAAEPLPEAAPATPFRLYSILESDPQREIFWGWQECSGQIDWGRAQRPRCLRIEVTNHSTDVLVNVCVVISLERVVSSGEDQPQEKAKDMSLVFDQIRPSDTTSTYLVNDSGLTVSGRIVSASGTVLGKEHGPLEVYQKSFPGMLLLGPAPRFAVIHEAKND